MSKNLENVLVKPAHKKETYTESQILEIANCADPVAGPQYFLTNFFYIQHPTKGKLLYQPFDYQKKLVDTYHNYRFSVSLMPRQTGKCLHGNSVINIKNNITGKEYELPIQIFHGFNQARKNGDPTPDISEFEVKKV